MSPRRLFFLAITAALAALPLQASASPASFVQLVTAARDAGMIDLDQYFIERFLYIFAPEEVSPPFLAGNALPVKDAVALVAEFERHQDLLRPETVSAIEALLAPEATLATFDTTHFRFQYNVGGTDGVPSTDTDADGIPDYIEKTAEYAEYSWTAEVTTMGFKAPVLSATNGNRMIVTFKNMNAYGVTSCPGGVCTMSIENDFKGFPANDDPEGAVAGAGKVTMAHEFKHTIQHATSQWSEGNWVELDATWMEDMAYDYVNDYASYINASGSQISTPTTSLDSGGGGSYYDAIWQLAMSERYGIKMIVDLWKRREANKSENMLTSYDATLKVYGSNLQAFFTTDYFLKNYLTNTRGTAAGSSVKYVDAGEFKLAPTTALTLGTAYSGKAAKLAGAFFEATSSGATTSPTLTFSTGSNAKFGVVAVMWPKTGGAPTTQVIPLSSGKATVTLGTAWSNLSKVGVVVANGATGGLAVSYNLTVK